ncbi:MAG: sulfatase-like hydrolase/transferase [Pirellulales bacterium]|nr:sulfatase-like hydrolase/transferase [Pirellulales bacterium]
MSLMRFLLIACFSMAFFSSRLVATEPGRQPNVILFVADDLGYGDISPYGGWIQTPNLERLAKSGVQFMDFHTSATVCSPTRAGLLTGLYQQRLGIPGVLLADPSRAEHFGGMASEHTTIAEVFREHGYRTAIFGKWHLGYQPQHNPTLHGFDEFRGFVSGNIDYQSHIDVMGREDWWLNKQRKPERGYLTDLISAHAVQFIQENAKRPFFLYLPHHAPHLPFQGPGDPADRTVGGKFPVAGSVKDRKRAYREMVQSMDQGVGAIMRVLKKQGIEESTMIWFFSDNGALRIGSNAPLRGYKAEDWEGGHRVPSIFSWPGHVAPRKTDALTSTLDVMPTVLDLAGIRYSGKTDGVDLSQLLLQGTAISKDRRLFWRGDQSHAWKGAAMREGPMKLVIEGGGNSRTRRPNIYLFDLSRDLGEQHNLAGQRPAEAKRMLGELSNWYKQVSEAQRN